MTVNGLKGSMPAMEKLIRPNGKLTPGGGLGGGGGAGLVRTSSSCTFAGETDDDLVLGIEVDAVTCLHSAAVYAAKVFVLEFV